MGNAQSSTIPPPSLCRSLCFRSSSLILEDEDGEWFGNLGEGKCHKKSTDSQTVGSLHSMPTVPEERESNLGDTSSRNVSSLLSNQSPDNGVLSVGSSNGSLSKNDSLSVSSSDVNTRKCSRRASDAGRMKKNHTTMKRLPNVSLTFINGQFVDLSTPYGQMMAQAANSDGLGHLAGGDGCNIEGIESSICASHDGENSPVITNLKKSLTKPQAGSSIRKNRKFSVPLKRDKSDDSDISRLSGSSTASHTTNNDTSKSKEIVNSIVTLGEGYFLTASRLNPVIKMWRVRDKRALVTHCQYNTLSIEFVRSFEGHTTGITCLVKVDHKGRFLSASKDCSVKVWDSRYNCNNNDEREDSQHAQLLATFDKIDQRSIKSIAITDDGSYVRPTDSIDGAMVAAVTKKAILGGSAKLQQAAKENQILSCSCKFASISGRHAEVKFWSMKHVENQSETSFGGNVAEISLEQVLSHDNVVESLTAECRKGILLTGDRMGIIRLWRFGRDSVFPGSSQSWSCERVFNLKQKSELYSVNDCMKFAISALSFLSDDLFASGSRGGILRIWNFKICDNNNDCVRVTGVHHDEIIKIQKESTNDDGGDKTLTFATASADGKVLLFAMSLLQNQICKPSCISIINHGIADRYTSDPDFASVTALASLDISSSSSFDGQRNCKISRLVSASNGGQINIFQPTPKFTAGETPDALLLYRQKIEEESLTLHMIAKALVKDIESLDRKKNLTTYKRCFLGSDIVSYLIENKYALTRKDAIVLGRVLASHLTLFEHVTKKDKLLEDDKSWYRFTSGICETETVLSRRSTPIFRSKSQPN